ncbi:BA75_00369T0 [Komagataella pastoris]|uniref:BA75_00369T0 n=1 Tax=Komagataella pastoris TaxID=4922 RepID=A0A1B2J8B7_PICPA|nr:BA75_00369T0 [Komagataella pastoris]
MTVPLLLTSSHISRNDNRCQVVGYRIFMPFPGRKRNLKQEGGNSIFGTLADGFQSFLLDLVPFSLYYMFFLPLFSQHCRLSLRPLTNGSIISYKYVPMLLTCNPQTPLKKMIIFTCAFLFRTPKFRCLLTHSIASVKGNYHLLITEQLQPTISFCSFKKYQSPFYPGKANAPKIT